MLPAIFLTLIVAIYGIVKFVGLYKQNQELLAENAKLNDELFEFKYVPRSDDVKTRNV